MELFNEIQNKIEQLSVSLKKLRDTGRAFAEAEKEYKIELRKQALKLRTEKNMPVTLIQQIIYGVPEVANLRFERDVKESIYNANKEAINVLKLQIRILEAQLSREWGNAK